jgi:hypothetical protein
VVLVVVFWLVLISGVLHIIEETLTGWVSWFQRYMPSMTARQFWIVNALFLLLCITALLVNAALPLFSLSVAALIATNGLIHIRNSVRERSYTPGAITAIFLYQPVATVTYLIYAMAGLLPLPTFLGSLLLGVMWMLAVILIVSWHSRRVSSLT